MPSEANGYEIKLIDDTRIEVIPNKNGLLEFEIDEFLVIIHNGCVSIKSEISYSTFVSDILSIKAAMVKKPSMEEFSLGAKMAGGDDISSLRTCIRCNGRTYCIINGCARTPCGSICDNQI